MTVRTLLIALVALATPLAAQDRDTTRAAPPDSANVTILDITVDPNVNEPHRVFLQKHVVYMASFSEPGVTIRMRSYGGKQLPFVVPNSNDLDATGGAEFELYPQADGNVEFTAVFNEDQRPVRFRIWSDARATERGRRSAEEGYWELGVEGLAGWHGRFSTQAGGTAGRGSTLGACFSVRNGPGPIGALNGCILGFERELGGLGRGTFFFTEPQLRLSHARRTDTGWRFDWGLVARYGFFADELDGSNFGPGALGFGFYAADDQRDIEGKGWRLSLTARTDGEPGELRDIYGSVHQTGRHWTMAYQVGIGRYF